MTGIRIAVTAVDHPDLDDWVRERAADEAAKSGVRLGEYLGRETAAQAESGYCFHLFATTDGP